MHINLHYEDRLDKTSVDLKLFHFGYESCEPSHAWGPGIKDHFKIHVVFKGCGVYKTPLGTYKLSQGDAFLTSPDTVISYTADALDPWTYGWFAFNGLNAEHYLARAGLSVQNPIIQVKQLSLMQQTLMDMTHIEMSSPESDLFLLSSLYKLLAITIASAPKSLSLAKLSPEGPQSHYLKEAINYIETHYSRKMRIETMAESIGIERKYLTRLFSTQFGISPQHYLLTYRMAKAKELLLKSNLKVAEVAVSVGYHDPFSFSRAFKQHFGKSPQTIKKP